MVQSNMSLVREKKRNFLPIIPTPGSLDLFERLIGNHAFQLMQ